MRRTLGTGLFALGILSAAPLASACESVEGRPSVGVVLSGGGARSAAQIGVLAELESRGVPIDCIAGTSIGAVVAGLYAAGRSPGEIREIFEQADWPSLLSGEAPRDNKPFKLKSDERRFFSGAVLGVSNNEVRLPSSVFSTTGIALMLRGHMRDVPTDTSYDALRIPLRVVATDLRTLEPVVFDRGDVVQTLMASMAVPGIFPAQSFGGKTYIDGGMSNQLPISAAKAMGADIIIAVDMTVAPTDPTRDPSATETFAKIVDAVAWVNRTEQIKLLSAGDILIQPDMSRMTTYSFERAGVDFQQGVDAAKQNTAAIDRILARTGRVAPPAYLPAPDDLITLRDVRITNSTGLSDDLIANRLGVKAGDRLSMTDLDQRVANVRALGPIGAVDYRLSKDGGLTLDTRASSTGTETLHLGVAMRAGFDAESELSVRARYSRRPLNATGAELSAEIELGSRYLGAVRYFQPLGADGSWFVEPQIIASQRRQPLVYEGRLFTDYWIQTAGAIVSAGKELGGWGRLSANLQYGVIDASSRSLLNFFQADTLEFGAIAAAFEVDTLDRVDFPRRGLNLAMGGRAFLTELGTDDAPFETYFLRATSVYDLGFAQILPALEAGYSTGTYGDLLTLLTPNDNVRPAGLAAVEFFDTEFVTLRLEGYRRLTDSAAVLSAPLYLGGTIEHAWFGKPRFDPKTSRELWSAGVYLGASTPIGPAYVLISQVERDGVRLTILLGRTF